MRLRPLKNLVSMFDVLGVMGFRFPDDQMGKPVSLWARLSHRAHILETELCHQSTIRLCPTFYQQHTINYRNKSSL